MCNTTIWCYRTAIDDADSLFLIPSISQVCDQTIIFDLFYRTLMLNSLQCVSDFPPFFLKKHFSPLWCAEPRGFSFLFIKKIIKCHQKKKKKTYGTACSSHIFCISISLIKKNYNNNRAAIRKRIRETWVNHLISKKRRLVWTIFCCWRRTRPARQWKGHTHKPDIPYPSQKENLQKRTVERDTS